MAESISWKEFGRILVCRLTEKGDAAQLKKLKHWLQKSDSENTDFKTPIHSGVFDIPVCQTAGCAVKEDVTPDLQKEVQLGDLSTVKDEVWQELLFWLIEENDFVWLQLCVSILGSVPNDVKKQDTNKTLLSTAVMSSNANPDIVELLIKNGADVNSGQPLRGIINSNKQQDVKLSMVKMLVKNGASINFYNGWATSTALHDALVKVINTENVDERRDFLIVKYLVQTDCRSINVQNHFGDTPLEDMLQTIKYSYPNSRQKCDKYLITLVRYLLEHGADPNIQNGCKQTAFTFALFMCNLELIDLFCQYGARIEDTVSNAILTPATEMFVDGIWNHEEDLKKFKMVLTKMIELGFDINHKHIDGTTLLHFVCMSTYVGADLLDIVLSVGASVHATDHFERTPLHWLARNTMDNPGPCFDRLVKAGADILACDHYSYTPLHYACFEENKNAVVIIAKTREQVEARGLNGMTPLHLAAENGDDSMINHLCQQKGVDVNVCDKYGATPLHYAAANCNKETMKALLELGADPLLRDSLNHTALWHARLWCRKTTSKILEKLDDSVPHTFPLHIDRVCENKEEVRFHFENIGNKLGLLGESVDIETSILKCPRLGAMSEDEEFEQIKCDVETFVIELMKEVCKLDSRFEGHLEKTGSTYEKVKVGPPDEFDFMWVLEYFTDKWLDTEFCVGSQTSNQKFEGDDCIGGFLRKKVRDQALIPQGCEKFLDNRGFLKSSLILRHFNFLLFQATYIWVGKDKCSRLSIDCTTLDEIRNIVFKETVSLQANLSSCKVHWRGPKYKLLDISLDIVPSIFSKRWPDNAILNSAIVPAISEYGLYIVPKFPPDGAFPYENNMLLGSIWRMSFSVIELKIIENCPINIRKGFQLAKAFKEEPLACAYETQEDGEISADKNNCKQIQEIEADKEDELQKDQPGVAVGQTFSQDDENETLLPHNIIPTYFLKILLIQELDTMTRSGTELSDIKPRNIAWCLYKKLQQCYQARTLASYFLPSFNILSATSFESNLHVLYCQEIVNLMERLNFDE